MQLVMKSQHLRIVGKRHRSRSVIQEARGPFVTTAFVLSRTARGDSEGPEVDQKGRQQAVQSHSAVSRVSVLGKGEDTRAPAGEDVE